MTLIDELLTANKGHMATRGDVPADPRPARHLAVVTCMDARIDVFAVLGLELGAAHVIRNAGGRVTEDVIRSLAVSSAIMDVDTVVVMQHTGCGMAAVTEAELRERTGADLTFLPVGDHAEALAEDVEILAALPFLHGIRTVAGFVYDLDTGAVSDVLRWERPD